MTYNNYPMGVLLSAQMKNNPYANMTPNEYMSGANAITKASQGYRFAPQDNALISASTQSQLGQLANNKSFKDWLDGVLASGKTPTDMELANKYYSIDPIAASKAKNQIEEAQIENNARLKNESNRAKLLGAIESADIGDNPINERVLAGANELARQGNLKEAVDLVDRIAPKQEQKLDDVRSTYNATMYWLTANRDRADTDEYKQMKGQLENLGDQMRQYGVNVPIQMNQSGIEQNKKINGTDVNNDGVIDRFDGIAEAVNLLKEIKPNKLGSIDKSSAMTALSTIRTKYNIDPKDAQWKTIEDALSALEQKAAVEYSRTVDAKERNTNRTRDIYKRVSESATLIDILKRLEDNPNSESAKSGALLAILRQESGAAIAVSEFGQKLGTLLSDNDKSLMMNEMNSYAKTGLLGIAKGALGFDLTDTRVANIINKYSMRIPTNEIKPVLLNKIGGMEIYKEGLKSYDKSPGGKPNLDRLNLGTFNAQPKQNKNNNAQTNKPNLDRLNLGL